MAFFKTHYYGGIRKYQWVTVPLALHGVVILQDGTVREVTLGEAEEDPVLFITDLLPHLAADQAKKPLNEAIVGESLNLLCGSLPEGKEGNDRVKLAVLRCLHEKYGMTEEDFLSAELEAVPAAPARDCGLDRSMIAAYGHDDRVCAFAELHALLHLPQVPERTAVCILADKEEIGSEGVTGMQSREFEFFVSSLCGGTDAMEACFRRSFCISADVCAAFDPNYPEVSERRNNALLGCGVAMDKFTGARGKSGASDASAETVGKVRRMFARGGVRWQMDEMGKVDQGGGGTIAMYMARRNIEVIDAGVPVLAMHAPCEVVSKLDCYMTMRAMAALYSWTE